MRLLTKFALVAALVVGGWAFASPWYAMWRVVSAADEGDSDTLRERVDFERVRAGMHADVAASRDDGDHDLLDQIGDGIVKAVAGAAIETAVTPQGLAVLLDASTVMPGEEWSWDVDRTGINTFTAQASLPDGRPGPGLDFERDGLGWVMVGVRL
jgi:hypothetical protein